MLEQSIGAKKRKLEQVKNGYNHGLIMVKGVTTIGCNDS